MSGRPDPRTDKAQFVLDFEERAENLRPEVEQARVIRRAAGLSSSLTSADVLTVVVAALRCQSGRPADEVAIQRSA